jgi:hypothetical protein
MNYENHWTKKNMFVKVRAKIKTYVVGSSITKSVLELKAEDEGSTFVMKKSPQYIVNT